MGIQRAMVQIVFGFVFTKLVIAFTRGILMEHDINLFQSILMFVFIFWATNFLGDVDRAIIPYRTGVLIGNDYWSNARSERIGCLESIKGMLICFVLCFVAISLITWTSPIRLPKLPDPFAHFFWGGNGWWFLELPMYLMFMVRLVSGFRSSE
jgi:hypothetical protein